MLEKAKNICIEFLGNATPSSSDVNIAIDQVLKMFPTLVSQREILFKHLASMYSIFSDNYRILDSDTGYIPWLKDKKASIKWNFWNRYESSIRKKIASDTINKLNNLTDDILDRIGDPSIPGQWDKRGMVVGQVQSGKTSNYTGLINKAADAGYKLIIVLAGMHDSLRSQTQIRIDEGFLGFNSQRSLHYSNTNKIGVGFYNPIDTTTSKPVELPANALTSSNLDGDFNRKVAQTAGLHLRSTDPIIAVVKKNGPILKNLITWLASWGDKQPDGKIIIRQLPFLLIDDEADNASINVSKDKVSTINACIRSLLSLFEQSAYVGYTATPFANIFIPLLEEEATKGLNLTVKDFEFTVGQDLFPKDFIINIPAPSNYIGPARVFGLPPITSSDKAEEPLPLIRPVKDYELIQGKAVTLIPDKHKKSDPVPEEIPESLKYAIKCFVLSAAARRVRNQINVHNSMLVHVSRFINWQDRIATLVDSELKFYQKQIELQSGDLMGSLKSIWVSEFQPVTKQIIAEAEVYVDPEIVPISWTEIEKEIFPAISKMEVRAVHGDKKIAGLSHHNISPLDYFTSEEKGIYLSVIAVGGDKLSRGLTLEGLTVSYYLRASKMYDTLMQMGRWFGYRPRYVDLCRIFTSDDLIKWYKHITIASEEMRCDFDYMFLLKKTPKEFGLKVRTHPGVLKITAANKFRYKHIMYLSYSGELEQTYQFPTNNKEVIAGNFSALESLISSLKNPCKPLNDLNKNQEFLWKSENNFRQVIEFLNAYNIGSEVMDKNKIIDYILAQTKKGNLVNWTIAVINNTTAANDEQFSIKGLTKPVGLTNRTNISNDIAEVYEVTKYNITDHRHELIDLDEEQIANAKRLTEEDYRKDGKKDIPNLPSRKRIKSVRNATNGLLFIYPLNPKVKTSIPKTDPKQTRTDTVSEVPIVGIAISFPENEKDEKVEYAVNEQFKKEYDYPDELDQNEENDGTD